MAGAFANFLQPSFYTTWSKEVLDGRELGPNDVLGHPHYPLENLAIRWQLVAIKSGDAASHDGAAVELFEDLRAHDKSFLPNEGKEALLCPL